MTTELKQNLKTLQENVKRYSPKVEKTLSKRTGRKPDAALVYSAAKYFPTLKKLASQ